MSRKIAAALFVAAFLASSAVAASPAHPVEAQATFHAVGKPGFLQIDGQGIPVTGSVAIDAGKVHGRLTAKLAGLRTGIDLRDEHATKKYLEVGKYPDATLVFDAPVGGGGWTGQLTLHGVTKPVTGTVKTVGQTFTAEFTVLLSDFGVDIPTYMGVTVASDVTVKVDGLAK